MTSSRTAPRHALLTQHTYISDLLRAKETFVTDEDDVVLVAFVGSELQGPVTGRWTLTAGDVHDVLEGQLDLAIDHRDWTAAIAKLMGDMPSDEPGQ